MTIDTKALRELAQKATPGPWKNGGTVEQDGGEYKDIIPTTVNCGTYCYGGSVERAEEADLEFIAAANPAVVLALLDELQAMREDLNDARNGWEQATQDLNEAATCIANQAATISRLQQIEAAAQNLAKVRGRHNSEIAMNKLLEALK